MKKITLIIGMLVAVFTMNAQNQEAYMKAMVGGLQKLGSAQSVEEMQAAAGHFERIAAKIEQTETTLAEAENSIADFANEDAKCSADFFAELNAQLD